MRIAIMAMGLPGSGKTTYLKHFAEKHSLAYINRDEIRQELLGDMHEQSKNKEIWLEANRRAAAALAQGQDVVLDATFVEEWKRRDAITFLKNSGVERVIGLFFNVPVDVARERNLAREKPVPDETMDFMKEKLASEPPSLESGFDSFYTLAKIKEFEKEFLL